MSSLETMNSKDDEFLHIVRSDKTFDSFDDDAEKGINLRPQLLNDFIGQAKVRENLDVFIKAAKERNEPLDHLFLIGPPGLGKTTVAQITARELGTDFKITSAPALEKPKDLVGILSTITEGTVFFIDEIHRLSRNVEEVLYSAMEDFALDIVIGKGPSARSIRLDLAPFTLIGATTKAGSLAGPLRDRFGVISRLEYYQPEDLVLIVKRAAEILQIPIEEKGAWEIARRSRGTPRIANRLLKRVRDFAQITGDGIITDEIADASLQRLEVDKIGLDHTDRRMLETMVMKFGGGPVGLDTLAAATSEERDTIEDVYEPYLLQLGFINRTPKGRVVTRAGYEHMNIPYPEA